MELLSSDNRITGFAGFLKSVLKRRRTRSRSIKERKREKKIASNHPPRKEKKNFSHINGASLKRKKGANSFPRTTSSSHPPLAIFEATLAHLSSVAEIYVGVREICVTMQICIDIAKQRQFRAINYFKKRTQ